MLSSFYAFLKIRLLLDYSFSDKKKAITIMVCLSHGSFYHALEMELLISLSYFICLFTNSFIYNCFLTFPPFL